MIEMLQHAGSRVDCHQHVWTEPLLDALAARRALPFVRRRGGECVLHAAGERPYPVPRHPSPGSSAPGDPAERLDATLVALSSPVGIEALIRDEAVGLIEAHLDGVEALGSDYLAWGPVALDGAEAEDVDALASRGCVGVSLPAGAIAGVCALGRLAPVLDRAAALRLPVFVHSGPAAGTAGAAAAQAPAGEPAWWPALTSYVAQMQAAWLAFVALGRRVHPDLVVVFAMLAGGAPLLSERLATRDGPSIDLHDRGIFYDTSSYGRRAISAMAETVGAGQLLYGSDWPAIEPMRSDWDAVLQVNSGRLLYDSTRLAA